MKVLKDLDHGLLLYRYGVADRFYLATTVLYCFDFAQPGTLLPEQKLWPLVAGQLGEQGILDSGMPKVRAEVLVRGKCCAAKGGRITAAQVRVKVGPVEKRLAVLGNRRWIKRAGLQVSSEPEPFAELDLVYAQAFGGPGFAKNPVGKGFTPEPDRAAEQGLTLPNVELPNRLIGSPTDRPDPAGLMPYDPLWPSRAAKLGTYDDRWLRERWPYLPDDTDYAFFNVAPSDQWLTGPTPYFKGDEAVEIEGMHPERPAVRSRLPGLRPRLFLVHQRKNEEVFSEGRLDLDTVWLFPSVEKGVVLYRNASAAADDEASDVTKLFLVTERTTESPNSFDYYREEFRKRLERKVPANIAAIQMEAGRKLADAKAKIAQAKADIAKLKEQLAQGQVPDLVTSARKADPAPVMDQAAARLAATAERLAGLQDKFGPMAAVDPDSFKQAQEKLADAKGRVVDALAQTESAKAQARQQVEALLARNPEAARNADLDKLFNPPPSPPTDRIPTKAEILAQAEEAKQKAILQATDAVRQAGQDPKPLLDALNAPPAPPAGLPDFTFHGISEEVKASLPPDQLRLALEQEEKAKALLADAKLKYGAAIAEAEGLQADPLPAWAKEQLRRAGVNVEDLTPLTREQLLGRYQAGHSTAGVRCEGVDLSGLDLHGIDLSGANLAKANLSGTNLAGANLAKALLNEANLSRANLRGAKLPNALMLKAKLQQADLSGGDLTKAVCSRADFTQAKLAGVRCEATLFEKATLKEADLSGVMAAKGYFLGADANSARFAQADLTKAVFLKASVDRADFSRTSAKGALFWEVSGEQVKFEQSDLTNMRVGKSMLPKVEFKESRMQRASLMGCDFTGGNFQRCELKRAMVDGCKLANANLYHATAIQAQFTKSDLSGANLVGLNGFKASFRKAKLVNTDLRGSNLYGAEFIRAEVKTVRLDDAILALTALKRHQPAQQGRT